MEVCYKAFRREVLATITIEEERFGFEPEITAKVAKGKLAHLRGPDLLLRPHLRGRQEDRLEETAPGPSTAFSSTTSFGAADERPLRPRFRPCQGEGDGYFSSLIGRAGAAGGQVKVSFYATIRAIVGAKTLEIDLPEGSSVQELLDRLIERCPPLGDKLLTPDGQLSRSVQVFVDGRGATYLPDGLETKLDPDQSVDIFPAVAGG